MGEPGARWRTGGAGGTGGTGGARSEPVAPAGAGGSQATGGTGGAQATGGRPATGGTGGTGGVAAGGTGGAPATGGTGGPAAAPWTRRWTRPPVRAPTSISNKSPDCQESLLTNPDFDTGPDRLDARRAQHRALGQRSRRPEQRRLGRAGRHQHHRGLRPTETSLGGAQQCVPVTEGTYRLIAQAFIAAGQSAGIAAIEHSVLRQRGLLGGHPRAVHLVADQERPGRGGGSTASSRAPTGARSARIKLSVVKELQRCRRWRCCSTTCCFAGREPMKRSVCFPRGRRRPAAGCRLHRPRRSRVGHQPLVLSRRRRRRRRRRRARPSAGAGRCVPVRAEPLPARANVMSEAAAAPSAGRRRHHVHRRSVRPVPLALRRLPRRRRRPGRVQRQPLHLRREDRRQGAGPDPVATIPPRSCPRPPTAASRSTSAPPAIRWSSW